MLPSSKLAAAALKRTTRPATSLCTPVASLRSLMRMKLAVAAGPVVTAVVHTITRTSLARLRLAGTIRAEPTLTSRSPSLKVRAAGS